MSGTRWVLLDDNDPRITYERRGWYEHADSFQDEGSSGPTFRGSQHVTNEPTSLSFRFNGTRIRLLGSTVVRNNSGILDPSWECFVDGESIGFEPPFATHQNNWPLCLAPTLEDGEHVLTLNVTTRGNPFYFDQIKYLPSPNLDERPTNVTVIVEQSDPTINYIKGNWANVNESARSTTEIGAALSLDFVGTKLWFIGWALEGSSGNSSAIYSVDGGPNSSFLISGPTRLGSHFFQTLFATRSLPPGSHNLRVIYEGPNRTALALDHFLIENGDIIIPGNDTQLPIDEPQPSNFASAAPAGPSDVAAASKAPVGAIAGGVAGGVVLLALFILVLLLIRKRMRSNLPPIPNFGSFGHGPNEPTRRYPRQSFSEAMVRKPSTTRSDTTVSVSSVPGYTYTSVYSVNSAKDSPFLSSETELNQAPIPITKLTPLRRHMVAGNTIPE